MMKLVILASLVLACRADGLRVGGFSEVKPANETQRVQELVDSIRYTFLEKVGWEDVPDFKAISYRSQVVAGTNYIVKVKLDESSYAHLRIFAPLANSNEIPKLTNYELNKALDDDIELLQAAFSAPAPSPRSNSNKALGAPSDPEEANNDVKAIVAKVKPDYIRMYAANPSQFDAVSFTTQTVNGKNYFVKVRVEGDQYVHLRIYQPLQGDVQLTGVQFNKKLADSVEYFDSNVPTTTQKTSTAASIYSSSAAVIVAMFFLF